MITARQFEAGRRDICARTARLLRGCAQGVDVAAVTSVSTQLDAILELLCRTAVLVTPAQLFSVRSRCSLSYVRPSCRGRVPSRHRLAILCPGPLVQVKHCSLPRSHGNTEAAKMRCADNCRRL